MVVRYQILLLILLLLKALPSLGVEVVEGSVYQKPQGLVRAIELLKLTPSGHEIYVRAQKLGVPIREGKISKTEITATRTFEGPSRHPTEKLNFVVEVLISQDKEPVFQALDLAHELVHAVTPKSNPFDPKLDATQYVQHGIEGEGGEAKAIAQECRIGKELTQLSRQDSGLKADTINLIKARCEFVWKTEPDESKWRKSFYQLGQYYQSFVRLLNSTQMNLGQVQEWKQRLAARTPVFSSAAAHQPYPVALLEEYLEVTRVICERTISSLDRRCKVVRRQ